MSYMVSEKERLINNVKSMISGKEYSLLLDMEDFIIDRNIAELSYWYASRVNGANIKRHEDVVADSKDLIWVYSFLRDVNGADRERLDNIIIENGDAYFNYMTAVNIDNVNKKRHGMVVFLSKDPEYNYLFAKDVDGADIKLHEKAIALSGNEGYINKYMRDIPDADLDILSNAIINGGNPYWNYVIARDYGINVLKHGDVVYKSLNPEYNYKFALKVNGADINLHKKAVYLSNDNEFISKFDELLRNKSTKKLVREKNGI